MAIIIPSSHIYEIDNPKIRNNAIDNIEVNAKKIEPAKKYRQSVYTDSFLVDSNLLDPIGEFWQSIKSLWKYTDVSGDTLTSVKTGVVYADMRYASKYEISVKIPINQNNSHLENLILGKDKNGNPNINVSYIGDIIKQPIMATWSAVISSGTSSGNYGMKLTVPEIPEFINNGNLETESDTAYSIPENINVSVSAEYGAYNPKGGTTQDILSVETILEIPDKSNLLTIQPITKTINGIDYYILDLVLIPYCEVYEVSQISNRGINQTIGQSFDINVYGYKTTYYPKQIDITILGNTVSLDIKDDMITIGSGSKKTFSIENNELIQKESYYIDNGNNAITEQFNNTLANYKNGKETATILCDIGNYYDENNIMQISTDGIESETQDIQVSIKEETGLFRNFLSFIMNKQQNRVVLIYYTYDGNDGTRETDVLSIDRGDLRTLGRFLVNWQEKNVQVESIKIKTEMNFQLHDEVIPMVYGYDGLDTPMSVHKDGTAKKFKVLGSRIFYDGAVWQELSLQEI